MSTKVYRAGLQVDDLMRKVGRLLVMQIRADRLICRYLADLADGMSEWSILVMEYGGVEQLLSARLGLTLKSLRERTRVGRALRRLPALDAALTAGHLTYSRVREVTRVATPDDEWLWVEAARCLSMRALERRVSEANNRVQSRRRVPAARRQQPAPVRADSANVCLSLPPDVWALVEQAVRVVRAAFGQNLTDAEALAAVARSALAHHNAPIPGCPALIGVQATDQACSVPNAARDNEEARSAVTHGGTEANDETGAGARREATHGGTEANDETGAGARREVTHGGTEANDETGAGARREVTHGGAREGAGRAPASGGRREAEVVGGTATQHEVSPDERRLLELLASGRSLSLGTLCDASRLSPSRTACALYELLDAGLVVSESMGLIDVFRLPRDRTELGYRFLRVDRWCKNARA